MNSTTLGKRSRDALKMEVRVILENHWATETVLVEPAPTLSEFFNNIRDALPTARRHTILGEKLTAPRAYLQETSSKNEYYRNKKYVVARWVGTLLYHSWYERNVVNGWSDTLRAEIHLRTNNGTLLDMYNQQQDEYAGTNTRLTSPYIKLAGEMVQKPSEHVWEMAECEKDEYEGEFEPQQTYSTEKWFPDRVAEQEKTAKRVKTETTVKDPMEQKSSEDQSKMAAPKGTDESAQRDATIAGGEVDGGIDDGDILSLGSFDAVEESEKMKAEEQS